jgi:RNA polymerase sigma-70 factor, ECF subfamily
MPQRGRNVKCPPQLSAMRVMLPPKFRGVIRFAGLRASLFRRAAALFTAYAAWRLHERGAAHRKPAGAHRNNPEAGTLSQGWNFGHSPEPVGGRVEPVSKRFSDQLIAVLPRLRRFAAGLTRSASEADDLVQAACERALTREHQFQQGTRFDSWMFRIVQTIWIDQLRARDTRKEDGDIAEERLGTDEPVRRVEARLALSEVRRAVSLLPPDQRMTLMLVTVEGLSYKQAADVAGVPVGTIMSRLARARIALQQLLEAGAGERRSAKDAEA